jgi:uncharacterized protein YbjT (DUF2867 family)
VIALSAASAEVLAPMRVMVTGAGGRTGVLVFEKLVARPEAFAPLGLVRSKKAAARLQKAGATKAQTIRSDVMSYGEMTWAMADARVDALIICTSAVPAIKKRSLVKIMLKKLLRRPAGRPEFRFPPNGTPEEVDYYGLLAQVDAAKAAGVKHIVLCSSMGGTDRSNFLNTIGVQPDGTGGEILLWKRKGEKALAASGLTYTIVHPGGLIDEAGGKRRIVAEVDDTLLKRTVGRTIPRADVAEVLIQALVCDKARNCAFDIVSDGVGEGVPTTDFKAFYDEIARGPAYDYSKGADEPKAAFPNGLPKPAKK